MHTLRAADCVTPETRDHEVDSLTGVYGRRQFCLLVNREIDKARHERSRVALLIVNISGFRRFNLAAGNHGGDLVLRHTARQIGETLRRCDAVGRLGDDEFGALLPGMISEGHATLAANKLLRAFDDPVELDGREFNIRINIGVALYPDVSQDSDQLFRHATMALSHAEDRGKSFSIYRDEEQDSDLASYAYSFDLRSAIEHSGLLLHYQPQWDLRSGRIGSAEALVRWPHPDHGMIGPNKFIPIAEQNNLIQPLTYWVINEAVRQCAAWRHAGLPLRMAVNLSTKLLQEPDLPDRVMDSLEIWSVSPQDLTLEVTETAIMEQTEDGLAILHRLASLGIAISIDDFGAGYSSFAYLCNLPAKELKVDRSIVNGVNGSNETVLRTIIELGHSLGMVVIAEGVEEESMYHSLERLGCDMIQGYLLSRPVAPDHFAGHIDQWHPAETRES